MAAIRNNKTAAAMAFDVDYIRMDKKRRERVKENERDKRCASEKVSYLLSLSLSQQPTESASSSRGKPHLFFFSTQTKCSTANARLESEHRDRRCVC